MPKLPVGTHVHVTYRHYRANTIQPWNEPPTAEGAVISIYDPRIWENTLAFSGLPTQEQVTAHVDKCIADGLTFDRHIPVEYAGNVFQWEAADCVYDVKDCPLCK